MIQIVLTTAVFSCRRMVTSIRHWLPQTSAPTCAASLTRAAC